MKGIDLSEPRIVDSVLQNEVEQFYYYEARLLDYRRFDEWLKLFDDDVRYWLPSRTSLGRRQKSDASGPDEAPHIDDDKTYLGYRVGRLATPFAWAEQPPARTRRIIGNITVFENIRNTEFTILSNFHLAVNRGEHITEFFAGERIDLLRRSKAGLFTIGSRKILLDQTVILANSLSVFF